MKTQTKLPPVSEAVFQRQVLQYAKLHGWRTAHFRPGRTLQGGWRTAVSGDGVGFPDTLFLKGDRCIVAELKSADGRLSAEQRAWIDAFTEAGIPAYIWRPTQHDWQEIEHLLGG